MYNFDKLEKNIINNYCHNINDTGSSEIQIILLNKKINKIKSHLKLNKNDNFSKAVLIKFNNKMFKLLKYLKKNNNFKYEALIKDIKFLK